MTQLKITQCEAIKEIHDRVRQCFTRHQFVTFGDAFHWMHNEDYEIFEMEAGEQGESKFSTDILWLTSQFGPKSQVDHKIMDVRKVPALKPVKVKESEDEADIPSPKQKTQRKRTKVSDVPKASRPKRKTRRKRRF